MNLVKIVGKTLDRNSKIRIKKFILKNINFDQHIDTYDTWVLENFPDAIEILKEKKEIESFKYRPLISITVPLYNTPLEFLHECILSVFTQSYDNWELILVDDASPNNEVRELVKEYAKIDKRIVYKFLKENHHIAGATNEAIKLATGKYIGLFDHDDILWPNALYEVVKALNYDREIDFIYTNEDKIIEKKSRHSEPFFKPDWSPVLLRTCNYITHFSVFKTDLLDKVGYENGQYNGAQDWEMIMRATRNANKVHHIPKIVYSWRVHDNSTAKDIKSKPYVISAQKDTIISDLKERGFEDSDFIVNQNNKFFGFWDATLKSWRGSKVSVVCISKKQAKAVARKTGYKNCEFIVADNYQEGLRRSKGEYIVFFEPDIKVESKKWVEVLLNDAAFPGTGLVGGLIKYQDKDAIYSAGIAVNQDGKLARIFSDGIKVSNLRSLTRTLYVHTRRNTTTFNGCVMVKKDRLNSYKFVPGNTTKQLVTLGLDLCEQGLNNIYDPDFQLVIQHKFKAKTRTSKGQKRVNIDEIVYLGIKPEKYKKAYSNCYYYDEMIRLSDNKY